MVPEIEKRCRTLLFHLRRIRSIRRHITQGACEKLVHALISSRLVYANSLLRIKQLQSIQNIAARLITGTRKFDKITPVLRSIHWLPIQSRIEFKISAITFRILHGMAPDYLSDLITVQKSTRCLRSVSRSDLVVPKSRTKSFGDRAFSTVAPRALQFKNSSEILKLTCLKRHMDVNVYI